MRTVFVDPSYWIARSNPTDQWHASAKAAWGAIGNVGLVTTEAVLTEFLTALSGRAIRPRATKMVGKILEDPNIEVIWQTRSLFDSALKLYSKRTDKEYSMQDCISMVVMEKRSIARVLTSDYHLEQEGFTILMKK